MAPMYIRPPSLSPRDQTCSIRRPLAYSSKSPIQLLFSIHCLQPNGTAPSLHLCLIIAEPLIVFAVTSKPSRSSFVLSSSCGGVLP